jgi:hypothetical protein
MISVAHTIDETNLQRIFTIPNQAEAIQGTVQHLVRWDDLLAMAVLDHTVLPG